MTRLYARLAILILPLFTVLAVTMSALGSTQPLHPALRGFVEGCEGVPQPCWYGIVPGVTSYESGVEVLSSLGYDEIGQQQFGLISADTNCLVNNGLGSESEILIFSNCPNIRVGDLIAIWGTPDEVGLAGGTLSLFFNQYTLSVQLATSREKWITPYTRVWTIVLYPAFDEPFFLQNRWYGFVRNWRYCQLLSAAISECTIEPTYD